MVIKYQMVGESGSDNWGFLDGVTHVSVRKFSSDMCAKLMGNCNMNDVSEYFVHNSFTNRDIVKKWDLIQLKNIELPIENVLCVLECVRNSDFVQVITTERAYILDDSGKTIEKA